MSQPPLTVRDVRDVKTSLEYYGAVIVEDVLSETEILQLRANLWQTLEILTGLDRNDFQSYSKFFDLSPMHGMLLQHYIGHAQPLWDVRQHPKVIEIFASLYPGEATVSRTGDNLITSFDGASISLPPEITNRGWHREMRWHCDQSFLRPGFETAQSWVTLYNSGGEEATIHLLLYSHLIHSQYGLQSGDTKNKDNYHELGPEDGDKMRFFLDRGCHHHQVVCRAGSMVLWDSRTIHAARGPLKGRNVSVSSIPPTVGIRAVIYVCMAPRNRCKNLQKRIEIFERLRMTYHHPYNIKMIPEFPRSYGNQLPQIPQLPVPLLTPLGMRLVGYNNRI